MAEEFQPKIFAFSCKRSSLKEPESSSSPLSYEDAELHLNILDCSGKIELVNLVEPFLNGADGIFTSGCSLGKCHFKSGNMQAESKIILGKKILLHSEINPERLAFYNLSPNGDEKFKNALKGFIKNTKSIGPLGSFEKLNPELLQLKLQAALRAAQGRKLSWIISRRYQFMEKGNRYGEIFTSHEMNRMLEDVAMDECLLQQILLLLQEEPQSAVAIGQKLGIPPPQALLHLTDLKRMGRAEISESRDNTPLWRAVGE